MNRGFLIQAQTEDERRQAMALAYSIKIHNKDAQVTLVCGELGEIEDWHEEPFDTIVEYPFQNKINPRINDWQAWWVTPYDETIVMDCASLVTQDLETIWEYLTVNYDMCFPGTVKDFRHTAVTTESFISEYKLNYINTAWFYFRKNETTMDYFKLADPYMQNHFDLYKHKFQPQHVPEAFDVNVTHSIIVNDMALENIVDTNISYIDMGLANEYFKEHSDTWTGYLNVWHRDNGTVKIQNYAVTGILYYKELDFLTDNIFNGQRNNYRLQTKVLRQVQ